MQTSSVDLKFITSLYNCLKHNESVAFSPLLAAKALGKTAKNLPQDLDISLQLDANNSLVNTIYFTQPFAPVGISCFQDEEFTTSSGEIIKLDEEQHAMTTLYYNEDADLKATITSFLHKGSDCLRLFMILPDQDSSMEELERKLIENATFENIIGKLKCKNVFAKTPLFRVDTTVDLAVSDFLPGSEDDQTRIQHKVSFGIEKEIVPPNPRRGLPFCAGIVEGYFVANRPVIFFVACMSSNRVIDDVLIYGKLGRPLLKK